MRLKRLRSTNNWRFAPIILALLVLLQSCGGGGNLYRVREATWFGDSISFRIEPLAPDAKRVDALHPNVRCVNCNLTAPEQEATNLGQGAYTLRIPTTRRELSPRLKIVAKDLDTTIIFLQPEPAIAQSLHGVLRPFVGRVAVSALSLLYLDTDQVQVVTAIEPGEEMNLFAEHDHFFEVHHPFFPRPLYLLKTFAERRY